MYLTIEAIEKSFVNDRKENVKVLDNINLNVKKGSFVSIVGPSGCGKSTLLYLVAGLDKADKGDIRVDGNLVTKPGPERVVVFQEAGLFPWLTVLENVTYGLNLKKIPKEKAKAKALDVLKMVHLSRYVNSYPHELSGGMKQRVSIARALVMEPDILLMDEPFSALDEQTRMVLHKELLEIWRKTKVTIFFITHNIREAVLLSEEVVVFATRPGRIKEIIPVPTMKDGVTPDSVTVNTEKRILSILQEEIEKVLKEEMGDDYSFYLVAGLDKADKGDIRVDGNLVTKPGPERVVVFQEAGLFPWLTVLENVTYGLILKKIPKEKAKAKALDVLKMVHLSRYVNSYPHELSGGMKQRVSIARALVMEPDILLMDEPFSALDEQTRMVLHKELLEIWRKTKVTIFFITHNIREAVLLSEEVVVFATRPGRIKEIIPVPTMKDGVTPDSVTVNTEKRILSILQEEIEKVLKEEMGDDYSFKTDHLHRGDSGDMGSHI